MCWACRGQSRAARCRPVPPSPPQAPPPAHPHTLRVATLQDARIQLMLYDNVLDLSAPEQAPDSKAARSLYKSAKYLLSEDAANYRLVKAMVRVGSDTHTCTHARMRTHTHAHTHAHTHTHTHAHAHTHTRTRTRTRTHTRIMRPGRAQAAHCCRGG